MISRRFGDGGWKAACSSAPPPLHVYDTESEAARWHPLPRIVLRPTPPGPTMVVIPEHGFGGDYVGDDPTDPARQNERRISSPGMIGRFNLSVDARLS